MRGLSVLLACLCVLTALYVQDASAQRLPPRNYENRGACPFECCTYREWSVEADTVLYRSRSAKSRAAFRVSKGERVTGLTGIVITLEPGRAVATGEVSIRREDGREVKVRRGDVLYLLHPMGEGVFKTWFRGRLYEVQPETTAEHAAPPPDIARLPYLRMVSAPRTVWWMKVRNKRGQLGWTKQNRHFGDVDACG
ncbi:MAG TPA: hypothetical protein VM914_00220 [Pyrinomonadaceae bacterium]|jgi:hypothetical protein|nr:hypothetical protein [Pyrinomonadaceae bacterium]